MKRKKPLRQDIIFAGFGGQGIMFMAKLVAQAAALSGLNVTWMPSYGAEVRGGTAHCLVRVSDREIASPVFTRAHTAIVMNYPSYVKFRQAVLPDGVLLVDSYLITRREKSEKTRAVFIPATGIAEKLGSRKAANMVMVGRLAREAAFLTRAHISRALATLLRDPELIAVNEHALTEGFTDEGA